jgi:hypothetical protein
MGKIPLGDSVDLAQGEACDDLSHPGSDPEQCCVFGTSA